MDRLYKLFLLNKKKTYSNETLINIISKFVLQSRDIQGCLDKLFLSDNNSTVYLIYQVMWDWNRGIKGIYINFESRRILFLVIKIKGMYVYLHQNLSKQSQDSQSFLHQYNHYWWPSNIFRRSNNCVEKLRDKFARALSKRCRSWKILIQKIRPKSESHLLGQWPLHHRL